MKKQKSRIRKKMHQRRKNLALVAVVVMVLCSVVTYKKIDLHAKSTEYKAQIEKLEEQMAEEEKRSSEINQFKTYVTSKEYIEEEARKKLGLIYPGEIIFKAED